MADESLLGTTVACPACQKDIQIEMPETDSSHLFNEPSQEGFLQSIETALGKMLRGVFRFIFLVFPPKLWHFFCNTFPWTARLIRILFLLSMWLLLIFWPVILCDLLPQYLPEKYQQYPPYVHFREYIERYPSSVHFGSMAWILLALAGSVWGIFYVRIKQKRTAANPT